MDTHEQDALLARLVRECSDARRELKRIREELHLRTFLWSRFSQSVQEAAHGLTILSTREPVSAVVTGEQLEQTRKLLEDAERLPRRIEEIRETLQAFGIEY